MTFGHIEFFVNDPLASREFYQDILGFELVAIQNDRFVWLKLGFVEILLRPGRGDVSPSYAQASSTIVLYTADLDSTITLLTSRGLRFSGTDGSPKCPTFQDPDGHWFQLVNPRE